MLPAAIQILQAVSGALWCAPLVLNTRSLWRLLRGRAAIMDILRAPYFFAALVMVLGSARWLIFRQAVALMSREELVFWAGIYVLSCGAGAAVTWSLIYSERFR